MGRPGASTSAAGGAAAAVPTKMVQKVVALPSHPLAQVGGHQVCLVGLAGCRCFGEALVRSEVVRV